MGCDIHAYIEYADFITREDTPYMSCFAEDIDIGRNYTLFSLMTGVRYDPNRGEYKPVFYPKGIPDNLSFTTTRKYTLYIGNEDDGESTTRENAERWVRQGSSEWANEEHTRVTHPDWHSASWLTVEELEKVQEAYQRIEMADSSWYQFNENIPEGAVSTKTPHGIYVEIGERKPIGKYMPLEACIAAMKIIDGDQPGRSRLVFWFDN